MSVLRIALTPGEPAGIGPDLTVQLAQQVWPFELVLIADPDLLRARAQALRLPLILETFDAQYAPAPQPAGYLKIIPVPLRAPSHCGILATANADYVLATLARAALGCVHNEFDALVTGPVHKGIINAAGCAFTGHTEFFADYTRTAHVVMLLATAQLRVALLTTHLPLRAVADAVTAALLTQTITILTRELQAYFGIARPRISVCGLNPHAGEQGHLGREEIDIIMPTLDTLRAQGYQLIGPLPADTLFTPRNLADADAVLALYHDQGLPVLKYSGFHQAVNITLGLPFIRTSVDHGTALELAGTGQADSGSLAAALHMASTMALQRKTNRAG